MQSCLGVEGEGEVERREKYALFWKIATSLCSAYQVCVKGLKINNGIKLSPLYCAQILSTAHHPLFQYYFGMSRSSRF